MRRIILSLVLLLFVEVSYSQKVFRKGIVVRGKEVRYQVLASKQSSYDYLVRNMGNPDTTLKPIPHRSVYTAQEKDIEMQIAEIVHNNLTPEELDSLKTGDNFNVVLRVNQKKHRIQQVTCFIFCGGILPGTSPEDAFWLNFDPDRLYKIEREIVGNVVLPTRMNKSYLTDDFVVRIGEWQLRDIEKIRAEREKAIKGWKKDPYVDREMLMFGPPREL